MSAHSESNPMAQALALSDEQFDSLLRLMTFYRRQAVRCLDAKAYLAGAVMVGAALEAGLIALVHVREDEIIAWPEFPKRRGRVRPLLDWDFASLLRAARYAGWLPRNIADDEEFSHKRAAHGDYAELLRQVRNLVHPTRHLEDFGRMRMTRQRLNFLLDVLRYLSHSLSGVASSRTDLQVSDSAGD
jgi:hypothetical protein